MRARKQEPFLAGLGQEGPVASRFESSRNRFQQVWVKKEQFPTSLRQAGMVPNRFAAKSEQFPAGMSRGGMVPRRSGLRGIGFELIWAEEEWFSAGLSRERMVPSRFGSRRNSSQQVWAKEEWLPAGLG